MPIRLKDVQSVIKTLKIFLSENQLDVMCSSCRNIDEGQFFKDKLIEINETIKNLPLTYGQDGLGDEAIAYMHYFTAGSDFYILELDSESYNGLDRPLVDDISEVRRDFGFVVLNGDTMNAELGYLSIEDIIKNGAELDIHFTPIEMSEVRKSFDIKPLSEPLNLDV